MKFKSAEADWNTSFVSQQVKGRNWRGMVARKLYRPGSVGVTVLEALEKRLLERRSMRRYLKFAASFLDERISDDGGADQVNRKEEKKSGSSAPTTITLPAH